MKKYKLTYKLYGETAILIEWPSKIDEQIIQDISSFENIISNHQKVLDTVIAYNSLTIIYSKEVDFELAIKEIKELYVINREDVLAKSKLWHIPVCYDEQFGLDLKTISSVKNRSVDEIIQLHSEPEYLLFFIGFQPGFLYLGGLNEKLHTPRIATPRLRLQKGSVGIGGEQTGIYPQDSAGGWNIIGKTPIDLFDVSKSDPCFAKAGDRIQFVPVDLDTFSKIESEIEQGIYRLKSQGV